jgi:hypothetical protein
MPNEVAVAGWTAEPRSLGKSAPGAVRAAALKTTVGTKSAQEKYELIGASSTTSSKNKVRWRTCGAEKSSSRRNKKSKPTRKKALIRRLRIWKRHTNSSMKNIFFIEIEQYLYNHGDHHL